ncbi:MAG: hypothetical protein KAS23_16380, partial [Anaerohalosphaera sp.]|nr:hypothetical protein [Anaerohalosphaera sp.]
SQLFADGLRFPGNIVWGGGTAYGNYLYVGDAKAGDVLKFDLAGNSTSFARPRREPYALGISNSGNLYCGTRVDDHVDYISPGGVVNNFSNFPYNMPGGPTSIEFDSSGNYGSGLFLSNDGADNDSGIFEINANGIASPFAPDIVTSFRLGFDDAGLFGYSLFTTGMTEFGQLWSMYSIDADGVATQFAHNNSTHLTIFSFGPDGAMYVAEHDGMDTTIISRIALIPEPVTFALLSIGGVLVRMRTRRS